MSRPDALLVTEDGLAMRGEHFGAPGTGTGELVFNTAMTGYQEVLTDPSYRGQIVTMTASHVGIYGCNDQDAESDRVQVAGFVVRELSQVASNYRSQRTLEEELHRAGVTAISGVDTRSLTRRLRTAGVMRAAVSSVVLDPDALLRVVRCAPRMEGTDLASTAGTVEAYRVGPAHPQHRVVAYDFGLKRSILRLLLDQGCAVTVVPANTSPDDVLAMEPDGVFLSNGPGDPAAVSDGVAATRALLTAGLPVFGICLGHQLLGRAAGADTYKLTFGHRGVNHPVRDADRGTVEITSHNHGFAVDGASLPLDGHFGRVRQTHVNLNDGVNEGLECLDVPAFSVQYHPEAAPGPHDARHLFQRFAQVMSAHSRSARVPA